MATKKNNQKNESANTVNNTVKLQGSEYTVKDDNGKGVTFESVIPAAIAEAPAQEEVSAISAISAGHLSKVQFSTYKTKKGDTAPQIIGFAGEDDPRWKAHKDAGHKYVSASYRRDINGEKVYILMFGVRYMDVAKALCGAYNTSDVNAWHRAEDACMAIYEQAQRDGKAKWEEKKAAWKAKADEKKAASKREQSGAGSDSAEREQVRPEVNAAKEQAKCYKPEDVAPTDAEYEGCTWPTLNDMKASGTDVKDGFPYREYDINLPHVRVLTPEKARKVMKEFQDNGFNVTLEAIMHNYAAWKADFKSGYRGNDFHLFTPCGCNPLSFRATTLHPSCEDWQTTYMC